MAGNADIDHNTTCWVHDHKQNLSEKDFHSIFGASKAEYPPCDENDRESKDYQEAALYNLGNQELDEYTKQERPHATEFVTSFGDNVVPTCMNHANTVRRIHSGVEQNLQNLRPTLNVAQNLKGEKSHESIKVQRRFDYRADMAKQKAVGYYNKFVEMTRKHKFNKDNPDMVRSDRDFDDPIYHVKEQYGDSDTLTPRPWES